MVGAVKAALLFPRRALLYAVSRIDATVQRPTSSSSTPSVTVIILCYRYGRYLESAVNSVLSQRGVDVDVVIVDDASPDDSSLVAIDLEKRDSRVRALLLERNVGPVEAFNRGLEQVTGKYLVRLDADDELAPDALLRAAHLMETHPEVGLVYGFAKRFTGTAPTRRNGQASSWTIFKGRDWLALRCRRAVNCTTSPEVMVRSRLQTQIGGQRPELGHTHDFEMWLRFASVADIGRLNDVDQAYVRTHADSRTATVYNAPIQDLRERRDAFRLALGDRSDSRASALLDVALRSVARECLDRARHCYERGIATQAVADKYADLAVETWPESVHTSGWRAYSRRKAWGMDRARYVPMHFIAAVRRSLMNRMWRGYWELTGL